MSLIKEAKIKEILSLENKNTGTDKQLEKRFINNS